MEAAAGDRGHRWPDWVLIVGRPGDRRAVSARSATAARRFPGRSDVRDRVLIVGRPGDRRAASVRSATAARRFPGRSDVRDRVLIVGRPGDRRAASVRSATAARRFPGRSDVRDRVLESWIALALCVFRLIAPLLSFERRAATPQSHVCPLADDASARPNKKRAEEREQARRWPTTPRRGQTKSAPPMRAQSGQWARTANRSKVRSGEGQCTC